MYFCCCRPKEYFSDSTFEAITHLYSRELVYDCHGPSFPFLPRISVAGLVLFLFRKAQHAIASMNFYHGWTVGKFSIVAITKLQGLRFTI